MLQLHSSNRLERLFDGLSRVTAAPLPDPMTPETVVVQNLGTARWIAQRMAERDGIAANLAFPLPASFFWEALTAWVPDLPRESGFDRETLVWRLMAELPRHLEEAAFAEPRRYLAGEPRDLKRLQLCTRLADLFDQYLVYRPDWLLAWEAGAEQHWQAVLWRALAATGGGEHRAALLVLLREALAAGFPPRRPLPERVSLFGLTALAPAYLEMLAALSRHTQVHLFLLNPCQEYWFDLVSERERSKHQARALRLGRQDTSALLDVGNPLLASMGHAVQELLDLLQDLAPTEQNDFAEGSGDTLLSLIQNDVLVLRDRRTWQQMDRSPVAADDRSVEIQVCHSPMREVQVLHDRLLRMFDEIPGLEPREIVVMAPDIDVYAPFVDAVFGAVPDEHRIPWSISDRRLGMERPLTAAFSALLRLPVSRLAASEVMALLEVPAVQRRFGLDQAGLERLRIWIGESGIRWGANAAMREELDLPPEDINTWDFGLRRLFLGYAFPPDQALYDDAVPYPDVEGGDAVHLGTLQELIEDLTSWRTELARPVSAANWQIRVNALIRAFFAPDLDEEQEIQALRDALEGLRVHTDSTGFAEPLSAELVGAWLEDLLSQPGSASRFLTGGVTFCNMVPMRSIPFRAVCLLGLNDTDFPRNQRPLGFDLMVKEPRRGDRSRRRDDRYLFLEALMSARERLYLSYVGRDIQDNSARVPSVLLGELTDYIGRSFRCAEGGELLDRITVEHPLQPFSTRYFDRADPRLFSYRSDWLTAARVARGAEVLPFADAVLEAPDRDWQEVDLTELIRFFGNPSEFFLTRRLGVQLQRKADLLEDVEAFGLAGLEKYGVRQALLARVIEGEPEETAFRILRGEGVLPHGTVGELIFDEQAAAANAFADRLLPRLRGSSEPLEVDLAIGPHRLTGWLPGPVDCSQVTYRFGKLRARDRISAWIRHLALCAACPDTPWESLHLAEDFTLRIDPVQNALHSLEELLDARWQGLQAPLCFFPETSLAYAEDGEVSSKVLKRWTDPYNNLGDSLDQAVAIAWRGLDPLDRPDFAELADRIWRPLLEVSNLVKAAADSVAA